jgi:hypothetical protein
MYPLPRCWPSNKTPAETNSSPVHFTKNARSNATGRFYFLRTENEEVILLTIYDKKVKEDLLPNELNELLADLSD